MFVGREQELRKLNELYESDHFQFAVYRLIAIDHLSDDVDEANDFLGHKVA